MDAEDTVRALWNAYQRRDWGTARALLDDSAMMSWLCTGERFRGADSIIHVNAVYPEGWLIRIIECNSLIDGRVHSIVRVDHPPHCFFATSLFSFAAERIVTIEEYWATVEAPPAWRSGENLPGYEVISTVIGRYQTERSSQQTVSSDD